MSNTEAKAWISSPGRPGVAAEGCRHAIKIDCGICHAEEFERDMNKEEVVEVKQTVDEEFIENMVEAEMDRDKYKKALEYIINSTECSTCRCEQVMGKTYQGVTFKFLQDYAMKALK